MRGPFVQTMKGFTVSYLIVYHPWLFILNVHAMEPVYYGPWKFDTPMFLFRIYSHFPIDRKITGPDFLISKKIFYFLMYLYCNSVNILKWKAKHGCIFTYFTRINNSFPYFYLSVIVEMPIAELRQ